LEAPIWLAPVPGKDGGTCINEAAIVAAGFEYQPVRRVEDMPDAYGRWEADAGGKKIGGHWTNVLMNEGGQWRTALHTWTVEQ